MRRELTCSEQQFEIPRFEELPLSNRCEAHGLNAPMENSMLTHTHEHNEKYATHRTATGVQVSKASKGHRFRQLSTLSHPAKVWTGSDQGHPYW